MEIIEWLIVGAIVVTLISGVLGFLIMRSLNRGFFKAIFYLGVAAILVLLFFWFFGQPPAETIGS